MNGCWRRILPVALRPGEGLLSHHIAGAGYRRQQPLNLPRSGHPIQPLSHLGSPTTPASSHVPSFDTAVPRPVTLSCLPAPSGWCGLQSRTPAACHLAWCPPQGAASVKESRFKWRITQCGRAIGNSRRVGSGFTPLFPAADRRAFVGRLREGFALAMLQGLRCCGRLQYQIRYRPVDWPTIRSESENPSISPGLHRSARP